MYTIKVARAPKYKGHCEGVAFLDTTGRSHGDIIDHNGCNSEVLQAYIGFGVYGITSSRKHVL